MKLTRTESWEPFILPDVRRRVEKTADRLIRRGEHLITVTENGDGTVEVALLCYHFPVIGRVCPKTVEKTGPKRRVESVIKDVDSSRRYLEEPGL